jgi:hypothetical protein
MQPRFQVLADGLLLAQVLFSSSERSIFDEAAISVHQNHPRQCAPYAAIVAKAILGTKIISSNMIIEYAK